MYQVVYDVALNKKNKQNFKAKEKLQKQDDNAQVKKKKAALTRRNNNERSKKQSQR